MKSQTLLLLFWSCLFATALQAQPDTMRVLFLGNSYTANNNLPNLVQQLGAGQGKTVIVDSHTPGGQTFGQHHQDATSLQKIRQGNWDAVVLQEQSQIPTIPYYRDNDMYPAARLLTDSIRQYNPCAKVCFYLTWGRRYGGQQCGGNYCSPIFEHMQDSLTVAYKQVAKENKGYVIPAGEGWRHCINTYGIALFSSDNSHPIISGSYLTGSAVLGTLFGVRTYSNNYNANIPPLTALRLRWSADTVVWGRASEWATPALKSDFNPVAINTTTYQCINQSNVRVGAQHQWQFSDGNSSTDFSPTHTFTGNLPYTATLISTYCGETDTLTKVLAGQIIAVSDLETLSTTAKLYPNPSSAQVTIELEKALSGNILIYNNLGQLLLTQALNTTRTSFNVEQLPKGCYTVLIKDEQQQLLWKDLLIKH